MPAPARISAPRLLVVALLTALVAGLFTAAPADAAAATYLTTPASKTVEKGTAARFGTRLTSNGNPVAGRTVKLLAYYSGTWRYVKSAQTISTGYAVFSYAPSATRAVKIVFAGDSRYAPRSTNVFRVTVTAPTSSSSTLGESAMREAARHLGKDYNWGSAGPYRFDCSGFTLYVFSRFGRKLPHNSAQQAGVVRRIAVSEKRPGDLIFFRTSSGSIDHVGIYAGGNYVYAASRRADTVKKQYIYTSRISVGRVS